MSEKYNSDELEKEAIEYIEKFKLKMREAANDVLGDVYVDLLPYVESDMISNFREAMRIELSHEYKYSKFRDDYAKDLRRAILVENREELADLLNKDIMERIKYLEDCKQEFEQFRYTPKGDAYQDKVKELEKTRSILKQAIEVVKFYGDTEGSWWWPDYGDKDILECIHSDDHEKIGNETFGGKKAREFLARDDVKDMLNENN